MFNKKDKTYTFSDQESRTLREIDAYIFMKNAELNMAKNMYGGVVDSALKRCGLEGEKLQKDGSKIDINLADGKFTVIPPEVKSEQATIE